MITFNQLYDRYVLMTKDNSTENIALGKALVNEYNQAICGIRDWDFLEKERNVSAVIGSDYYRLPADWGRLMAFWVEVSTNIYYPNEVFSQNYWRLLKSSNSSNDVVNNFFIYSDHIGVYPTPVTINPNYHMLYRRIAVEMENDDYSTGTISSVAKFRTVTGVATVWTSAMAGRSIKIGGIWYEITSVTDATNLVVEKPILTTVSGATYVIGEVSPIPGEFHDLLWKGPVADYFDFKGMKNPFRDQYNQRLGIGQYKNLDSSLVSNYGSGKKSTSQVIKPRPMGRTVNPNFFPTGMT